ncbi:putative acid shock protein [Yersinia aldovae]|uniref:Putative acid shock protein n=1 Tax=Yersinia aldovae TaxID=29483 RepID=A0A0T9T5A9_YERAL|nr:acid resistance repetitive basic protein Asr [Yersinia aldovae]CNK62896.1 putative acid shock protein [Yersinia aldovae]
MRTLLALIVAASMGISSVAFAADMVAPTTTPTATAPSHSAPVKTVHHEKAKKSMKSDSMKKTDKTAPVQKAQAAPKQHKKTTHSKAPTTATPAVK